MATSRGAIAAGVLFLATAGGVALIAQHARAASPPDPAVVDDKKKKKDDKPTDIKTAAAKKLYTHVVNAIRDKRYGLLGYKGHPNAVVRDAQRVMGAKKVDGIYGPASRALGAKILGHAFPARPPDTAEVVDDIPDHAIDVTDNVTPEDRQLPPPAPDDSDSGSSGGSSGSGARSVTLSPGKRYRVQLQLEGLHSLASDKQIVDKITEETGPWASVKVTGSGASRTLEGTYKGQTKTLPLTQEIVSLIEVKDSTPAKPSSSKALDAANALYKHVVSAFLEKDLDKRDALLGTSKKPNAQVKAWQKAMGSIAADGVYGSRTEARGEALTAHDWPTRPKKPKVTIGPAVITKPAPAKQQAAPAKPSSSKALDAANALYKHVVSALLGDQAHRDAELGTSKAPNAKVKSWQQAMGSIVADGVYGSRTEARGEALTAHDWPTRPKKAAAPARQAPNAPAAASSPAPAQHAAAPPAPAASPAKKRTPTQAANELYDYATAMVRQGRGSELGDDKHRNERVAAAQRDMNGPKLQAALDRGELGIYGPLTRARGKELTGKEFPARDYKPPAAHRTAKQAGDQLYTHVVNAIRDHNMAALGKRGAPNAVVRAAQQDMGMSPAQSDGIYGSQTQAKGAAVTGHKFPDRPAS